MISLCVAALLAVLACHLWKSATLGEAPDITLVTTRGDKIALVDLRGKPLLVTFWATTCKPCIEEIPRLIDLYHELSPRGLKVVGIAIFYDPPNRVLAVQDSRHIPYTIAIDIDAHAARAFGDVEVTPTTFLIAPDGRVVYRKVGTLDVKKVRGKILAMLGYTRSPRAHSTSGGS